MLFQIVLHLWMLPSSIWVDEMLPLNTFMKITTNLGSLDFFYLVKTEKKKHHRLVKFLFIDGRESLFSISFLPFHINEPNQNHTRRTTRKTINKNIQWSCRLIDVSPKTHNLIWVNQKTRKKCHYVILSNVSKKLKVAQKLLPDGFLTVQCCRGQALSLTSYSRSLYEDITFTLLIPVWLLEMLAMLSTGRRSNSGCCS